jgi:hypothetical protein
VNLHYSLESMLARGRGGRIWGRGKYKRLLSRASLCLIMRLILSSDSDQPVLCSAVQITSEWENVTNRRRAHPAGSTELKVSNGKNTAGSNDDD